MNPEADGGDWRTELLGEDGVDDFCFELQELTKAIREKALAARGRIRIMQDPFLFQNAE